MAKNKVLTEKTDINTPFSEFVRKFKNRKQPWLPWYFWCFLWCWHLSAIRLPPYGINEYDYSAIMQPPTAAHLSAPMSSEGICFPG